MRKWLLILVIGALVFAFYGRYYDATATTRTAATETVEAEQFEGPERPDPPPAADIRCDGRTRCPEMRSCEEAEYFLSNCPGVKMDGDRDGVPCEDQHCSHKR